MARVNDISDYYTEERALAEEVEWILRKPHASIIEWLSPRAAKLQSVVEFGCGSGIVASSLPQTASYVGVDSNEHFIRMAKKRCPNKCLMQTDVRDFERHGKLFDLAMAWNFFKHFQISELEAIFASVLTHGRFGAFNVQVLQYDLDNGQDYHHVHITDERLTHLINSAGHREVERHVLNEWSIAGKTCRDTAVWTENIHA
jgi:predicted TPR repeat methyltransferase